MGLAPGGLGGGKNMFMLLGGGVELAAECGVTAPRPRSETVFEEPEERVCVDPAPLRGR